MPSFQIHPDVSLKRATCGSSHYFFGYYDKSPWDKSGRWLLGMRSGFMDRPPGPDDSLELGVIDTQNGTWRAFAESKAWNWQQGCMLQWLNDGRSGEVVYNDREDRQFVSRIHNIFSNNIRTLPKPIYAVDPESTLAVTPNFSRLQHQRPGYGYPGVEDPWRAIPHPTDDGIYSIDLATGESRLIISIDQIVNFQREPASEGRIHRFNHLQFSPDGKRFIFLHRYRKAGEEVANTTRLFTANREGGELSMLANDGLVSHFDWYGNDSVVAWANQEGTGEHYYRFKDRSSLVEIIGKGILDCDGHCSFSNDKKWMLTDTYPDEANFRTLLLYRIDSECRIEIGRFYSPPVDWEIRCDLHPRWARDGKSVCIDSAHEGNRQMYVLDVSEIVSTNH